MRQINNHLKNNFLKRIFVKICRILGYELIDQNNLTITTLNKKLGETTSLAGQKSINIPLGEVKITRKVENLDIIIRTCTNVKMLTQNKERIFEKEKLEYTLKTINSIVGSITEAKKFFDIEINLIVVDHNSSKDNINRIKNLLSFHEINFRFINLDIKEFYEEISKKNEQNEKVINNQLSNMSNIRKSFELSKSSSDLVYFVEDDYLHKKDSLKEMLFAYERISSQTKNELIICPADYPYLYSKIENTEIYLGEKYHWRKVNETLCTFLTSKKILNRHWEKFLSLTKFEHYPFEKPLHEIYKKELCISPIPSLAIHLTNINSIYGISPNVDFKKIWFENDIKY